MACHFCRNLIVFGVIRYVVHVIGWYAHRQSIT